MYDCWYATFRTYSESTLNKNVDAWSYFYKCKWHICITGPNLHLKFSIKIAVANLWNFLPSLVKKIHNQFIRKIWRTILLMVNGLFKDLYKNLYILLYRVLAELINMCKFYRVLDMLCIKTSLIVLLIRSIFRGKNARTLQRECSFSSEKSNELPDQQDMFCFNHASTFIRATISRKKLTTNSRHKL